MKISDSLILKHLPEYLIDSKGIIDPDLELLEQVNPNSFNLPMALMDRALSVINKEEFNHWENFDRYAEEFKLKELFDEIGQDIYNIKNPELLKGFLRYKGTYLDILYLMKLAGYTIELYDYDYYMDNLSIYNTVVAEIPGAKDYMPDDIDSVADLLWDNSLRVYRVNNKNPIKVENPHERVVINEDRFCRGMEGGLAPVHVVYSVDNKIYTNVNNVTPMKVVNVSRYIKNSEGLCKDSMCKSLVDYIFYQYESVLEVLPVDNKEPVKIVNSSPRKVINISTFRRVKKHDYDWKDLETICEVANEYIEAREADFSEYECSVIARSEVDLENPLFSGMNTRDMLEKVRKIIESRISICVYLGTLSMKLIMRDYLRRDDIDSVLKVRVDKKFEDLEVLEMYKDMVKILKAKNQLPYIANNKAPLRAINAERFSYDYMEEDFGIRYGMDKSDISEVDNYESLKLQMSEKSVSGVRAEIQELYNFIMSSSKNDLYSKSQIQEFLKYRANTLRKDYSNRSNIMEDMSAFWKKESSEGRHLMVDEEMDSILDQDNYESIGRMGSENESTVTGKTFIDECSPSFIESTPDNEIDHMTELGELYIVRESSVYADKLKIGANVLIDMGNVTYKVKGFVDNGKKNIRLRGWI